MERMDYRHEEFQFEEGSRIQVFDVAKKQETLHCHDCLEPVSYTHLFRVPQKSIYDSKLLFHSF